MEIVLIRHFATPGNKRRAYIGRTDEGIDTERLPHGDFPYPPVDVLAVSPLKRCIQTGAILYPKQEPVICPLLREMDFGEYEGKTYEELKDEKEYQRWLASGGEGAFPGGEDRESFQQRCRKGVEEAVTGFIREGKNSAAFVVHGGTIMAAMSYFDPEKKDFYHWQVKNGSGYQAEINEEEWMAGVRIFHNIRMLHPETGDRR